LATKGILMDIEKFLQQITNFGGDNAWIYQIFVVVFVVLLANLILMRILTRIQKTFEKTKNTWDDALLKALRRPLRLLVWIVGLSFAAQIAKDVSNAVIFEAVGPLRDVGVIATMTWFIIRFIKAAEENIVKSSRAAGNEIDKTTADAISRLLRISILITATLVVMQTLGYSVSGVLAFGGIGGIAIGFAAKDLLSNFFGGLMIFLDRPFSVGDWIRSPDRKIEGTVEAIGWRLTRIRTFSKRPLYVPNSVFANVALENPSRMSHRRIKETIGVRYDDAGKLATIIADVKKMLLNHPDIDTNQTLMVNFNSYAPSSLDFFIYTFTKTTVWTEFHEIKQDVLLKINDIIASHDAEIAFPTSTIHMAEPLTCQVTEQNS